jgi:3-dehydroquinate dehydratase
MRDDRETYAIMTDRIRKPPLLSKLQRPFVVAVIVEPTLRACGQKVIEFEESWNPDGFEINIGQLRDIASLRDIFASTTKPCIATHRRAEFMRVYGYDGLPPVPDHERAGKLLKALDAGARVLDFELDIFDETWGGVSPGAILRDEFSTQTHAVEKQMKLVESVRSMGSEVLLSCHMNTLIRFKKIVAVERAMEERGADFGKIVVTTRGNDEFVVFLDAVRSLKSISRIPFVLMNVGKNALLGRLVSLVLGSSWVYCRSDSKHDFLDQPTVSLAREFLSRYL